MGKFLNLRLFGDGGIDCVMSDELCDEFVSWTNYFERRLAFAVREIRWVEDLRTFERVACVSASFEYGLETAGLLAR